MVTDIVAENINSFNISPVNKLAMEMEATIAIDIGRYLSITLLF